jgi:hypothetical protein
MPKIIKANSKAIRKSEKKAKNIQLAVEAYIDSTSGLLLRAAVIIYDYSKISIINHFDNIFRIRYTPDIYIERQLFTVTEETVLYNYIREYYQSYLFFDVELLYYYVNELLQARVGPLPNNKKIEAN